MKLIDKDSLVAEIKRLKECCYKICAWNLDFLKNTYPEHYYSIKTYDKILSFLNTLEVKEVDLEKLLTGFMSRYAYENDNEYPSAIDIAKHFFELGIAVSKTQKGVENEM